MLPPWSEASRYAAGPRRRGGVAGGAAGIISAMTTVRAELSSISTTLGDLTRRVSALAEQARRAGTGGDGDGGAAGGDLAAELFTVERSLKGALRRLERAADGRR